MIRPPTAPPCSQHSLAGFVGHWQARFGFVTGFVVGNVAVGSK